MHSCTFNYRYMGVSSGGQGGRLSVTLHGFSNMVQI